MNAFSGCSALERVVLPDSIWAIGAYAFDGCVNLVKLEFAASKSPFSCLALGNYAFRNAGLAEFVFAPSVRKMGLGTSCFSNCVNLHTFNFTGDDGGGDSVYWSWPDTITSGCGELSDSIRTIIADATDRVVSLGISLSTIDNNAFENSGLVV